MTSYCNIPVSLGELYDKYSILEIKREKIKDATKLSHVKNEMDYLKEFVDKYDLPNEYREKIKNVNSILWDIEDKIRIKEQRNEFDDEFIQLARLVYKTNDQRSFIKNEINKLLNSTIMDIKSYYYL